jgi:tetratricopeptide (TPR) repeat protein
VFALQDEITGRIATELNVELIGAEAARPNQHPSAVDYVLRGRANDWRAPSRGNYAESIRLFERALALDAQSTEAKCWLASVLVSRVLDHMADSPEADIARAVGLVEQAWAASPRSAITRYAKGQVLRTQGRFEEAIPEYEAAIASNRNWVTAIAALGQSKFYAGSIEDAIPAQEQAIRLSPRDPFIWLYYFWIGEAYLLQSRTDDAIFWLERARAANVVHALPHAYLASAYGLKGEIRRAGAELADARKLSDGRYTSITQLKSVEFFGVAKVAALFEATFFVGLRRAGMQGE